jgi:hypothetical protein
MEGYCSRSERGWLKNLPFLSLQVVTELKVSSLVVFAIISGLLERIAQWEAAYLPGWMAHDVADAR